MKRLGARNQVRITGGAWRGRLLRFSGPVRPTMEALRQTLFNWIGQDLLGKSCLDLFAGSGALGFEAASRRARQVVLVEKDEKAARALMENRQALGAAGVSIARKDAGSFLGETQEIFDVIFADPPYGSSLGEDFFSRAACCLREGGFFYLETPKAVALPPGFVLFRQKRLGAALAQLYRREGECRKLA